MEGPVNIEDTLFAGAVISRIKEHFTINCDSSQMAETMYNDAKDDLYEFMKLKMLPIISGLPILVWKKTSVTALHQTVPTHCVYTMEEN